MNKKSLVPILAGQHALLIAPTAGGKTEAAVLPVLSRMLTEDWRGLSVLYICPIKALLNNLEQRLLLGFGSAGRFELRQDGECVVASLRLEDAT